MWEYVLGGATVFGAIVAMGAWVNGKITRREISRLIIEEHKYTKELIIKIDERISKMDERFSKMDERFEAILKSIEAHIKTSTQQHQEILEAIRKQTVKTL